MIAVVFIHASVFQKNLFQQMVLTISGCAVPLFFMLSGAFILDNEKTVLNLKKYYLNKIVKIIIPTVIFSLLYIILEICFQLKTKGLENLNISYLLKNWVKTGIPGNGWHLWFMRVIIFFYLVAPLLILLRKNERKLYIIIFSLGFVFAVLNFYFSFINFNWQLNWIFYIPLIIAGDIIKNFLPKPKHTILLFFVIILLMGIEFLIKSLILNGSENIFFRFIIHDGLRTDCVVDPANYQLFNLLASILIFYVFKNIKVKQNRNDFAELCFYIYLVHYALEGIINGILLRTFSVLNIEVITDSWYWIIIRGTLVLAVSYFIMFVCREVHILVFEKLNRIKKVKNK